MGISRLSKLGVCRYLKERKRSKLLTFFFLYLLENEISKLNQNDYEKTTTITRDDVVAVGGECL